MKHFKRAAAMLLAVVLSLCLAVTAFAEGTDVPTGTLTVTGSGLYIPDEGAGKGKNVTAIRMFTARATEAATPNPNTFDSYVLENKWEGFFKQDEIFNAMKTAGATTVSTANDLDSAALSDAAVAYINTLLSETTTTKGTTLVEFAHKAQNWARKNSTTLSAKPSLVTVKAATQDSDEDKTKGTATFTDLTAGYYLVFPEGGSTGKGNRKTDAILVNVPRDGKNTAAEIKSTFPTVDKQVSNDKTNYQDNTTAQVGDTVTFKLTAKVPDMADYTAYKFVFHDTLSNGLEFVANSVEVSIASNKITAGDNTYSATYVDGTKKLTVAFTDLKNVVKSGTDKVATDDEIVVTYKAKITKDAVTTNPATNKAHLEYSNDPSGTGTGTSNPDESKVYTYDINIFKYYKGEGNTETGLANATFKLTSSEESTSTAIELVKEDGAGLVYHVKGDNETGAVSVVTTGADGKITIKGLKAGTYYLHETIAPTGYNKLKKPIKIEITVTDNNYTTPSYKVDGKANADNTIKVENVKGVMLPETGSIGTIGLTALGVAVVLLGVFAPRKKKKENQ
jgi:fimbrial isopeptide formation D2 family protein/LPXTG-motif cell wall-anchored protein